MPGLIVLAAVLASIAGWTLCILSMWRTHVAGIGIAPLGEHMVLGGAMLISALGISCLFLLFDQSGLPAEVLWIIAAAASYSLALWFLRGWLSKTDKFVPSGWPRAKRRLGQVAVFSAVTTILASIPVAWVILFG